MRATEFEFHHRFWFILLIFFVAFGCYVFEPVNAVEWLLKLMGGSGADTFPKRAIPARVIFAVGAVLVAAAAWVRTWGTAYLRTEVVRDTMLHAERLVADGPYRYVRNPLYFGTMLLALGLCPMASPVGSVALVAGMWIFVLRLIGCEEALLRQKHGDAYRAYVMRVPRLWPALRPRVPAGGADPHWGQAWAGEMWMWAVFAGSVVFAFTLNPKLFDYIVWAGFILLYAPVRILIKRRVRT
jgi:protein-S-isoprenylcysteine O-methyltransferase Ste14